MTKSRLKELYDSKIRADLKKKLNKKNIMEVPQVSKVVLNVGAKEAVGNEKLLQRIMSILGNIAGQKPVKTLAKKSVAGFKIREGMPIGAMVTLRKGQMYNFLDKLINVAIPKIRDFQGVSPKLDSRGNYNLGIKEWTIFPEADLSTNELVHGLNVSIQTTAKTDEDARELLTEFGMPFKEEK